MKTTTSLVYKTVRPNGTSIYVPVGLGGRRYEIGKRYRFKPQRPTFVFIGSPYGLGATYDSRREDSYGNRVLICLTKSLHKQAAYGWALWNDVPEYMLLGTFYVCNDLLVIGEVFVPHTPAALKPTLASPRKLRQALRTKYNISTRYTPQANIEHHNVCTI